MKSGQDPDSYQEIWSGTMLLRITINPWGFEHDLNMKILIFKLKYYNPIKKFPSYDLLSFIAKVKNLLVYTTMPC